MSYDLLIKNGRIVDGSGGPSYRGDVGVKDGKIVEIGKLSRHRRRGPSTPAARSSRPALSTTIAITTRRSPGTRRARSPATTAPPRSIFGNCSLSLAPVKKDRASQRRLSEFLSYVEAIPMEVLDTLEFTWETFPEYLDQMDHHLGVNVGNLIGHTAVRHYVMGDECQKRTATDDEIRQMQDLVREGMKAGALGLSVSRNQGHFDPQGVHIPAIWADEKEIFALGDVLREMGTGLIQSGGGNGAEMKDALMSRLAEATGRVVVYNNLGQTMRRPGQWQKQMAQVDATTARGIRAYPDVHAEPHHRLFPDAQHPDLPRHAGMAPDLPVLARGAAEGLCRPRGAPEAPRRGGRIQGRPGDRHLLDLVGLHGVADRGAAEEQADRGQDGRPDRQGAGQGHHRRLPRPGGRGEPRHRMAARREQCRRRRGRARS